MPTAMRSRPASSLPAMSRYRDAQLPSPSPPDAVQDRCLGPVAFVRWLPSSVAFAIARPRPQSKTAVQDRCLRHRLRCLRPLPACVFAPCHVTLAAMRSCLRHRHRCSRARSRPWPCHATDACIHAIACSLPAMAMSRYRDAQLPSPSPPMQSVTAMPPNGQKTPNGSPKDFRLPCVLSIPSHATGPARFQPRVFGHEGPLPHPANFELVVNLKTVRPTSPHSTGWAGCLHPCLRPLPGHGHVTLPHPGRPSP